jgi:succinate dehydrogenase/fumarate reductase-like Fe-S protein
MKEQEQTNYSRIAEAIAYITENYKTTARIRRACRKDTCKSFSFQADVLPNGPA